MSITPAAPSPEDLHIATAERRRAKLERLSDIGMGLAERIGADAAAVTGDPARAFAVVSRAVRMTLALEARFDDHIQAVRRGETPAPRRVRAAAVADTAAEPEIALPAAKPHDPVRMRVDAAVREAIHLEVETITDARERLDALGERLFDRESYDVLLRLPLRDAVAAICADLGLEPDWSLWSDEAGFVAPPGRRRIDWTTLRARSFPPRTASGDRPPPGHRRE